MSKVKSLEEPVIVLDNLTKVYPGTTKPALDRLTIRVHKGEVYGFIGPNGAGKSTAIRMLMNFIVPSSGTGTISGKDIVTDTLQIRNSIGYLSGDFAMYPKMTGDQFIRYMNSLQTTPVGNEVIAALAKRLKANLYKPIGELSRGNRQKIGIIQAFMHDPRVLILDEPTSGLDPLIQETFLEMVRELKSRGACIFMSSHVLSEVQKVCDRVGIIKDGKLVSEKDIADMATEAAQTFEIVFSKKVPISALRSVPGIKIQSHQGGTAIVHMYGALAPLFAVLARHEVLKIDARNLDLEESFMHFYQDEETDS